MESTTRSEEMFSLIEGWQRSGESQRAWCASHGISRSAFKYWLGKYRRSHSLPPAAFGNNPIVITDVRGDSIPASFVNVSPDELNSSGVPNKLQNEFTRKYAIRLILDLTYQN